MKNENTQVAKAPISPENITFECIKQGIKRTHNETLKSDPQEAKISTYKVYSVSNPKFRGKPFSRSSPIVIGNSKSSKSTNTKKVSTNQDSLRNKKLRLDRKYAHDPSYLQNRTSKVINVKVLEGITNTYKRMLTATITNQSIK